MANSLFVVPEIFSTPMKMLKDHPEFFSKKNAEFRCNR